MKRVFLSTAAATLFVLAGSIAPAEAGGGGSGGIEVGVGGEIGVGLTSNSGAASGAHTGAVGGTGWTGGNAGGYQKSVAIGKSGAFNHGSVDASVEVMDAGTTAHNISGSYSFGAGMTTGAGPVSAGMAIGEGQAIGYGVSDIKVDIDAYLAGGFEIDFGDVPDIPDVGED